MEDIDQKRCPECSSLINFGAQKCPFCLSLQTKHAKQKVWVTIGVPMLMALVFFTFMLKIPNRHHNRFTDYTQKVQISSSEFRIEKKEEGRVATVTGTIRNDTDLSWEHPNIEVQYFNRAGKLIDTVTEADYELRLSPHTEQAFKVHSTPSRPDTEYASRKVFLRYAEDANRFNLW